MVKDADGNRWFCVQPSTEGAEYGWYCYYSYFVTFDQNAVQKMDAPNSDLIPGDHLGMQMLFDLDIMYHNYITSPTGALAQYVENIQTYAGIDLDELFGLRDSTVTHGQNANPSRELNTFLSIYVDHGRVLRAIGDYTTDQAQACSWKFYTKYTNSDTDMQLSDLQDQNRINQYNKDPWALCSWYNWRTNTEITANTGYRTSVENFNTNTPSTHFAYKKGQSVYKGNAPANMYREPLYFMRVHRVRDRGAFRNTFEDDTPFTVVKLARESMGPDASEDKRNIVIDALFGTYDTHRDKIYLDGQVYSSYLMDNYAK